MSEQLITVWKLLNRKTDTWDHNHISDGYDENQTTPPAHTHEQKSSWARMTWKKQKATLINGVVHTLEDND